MMDGDPVIAAIGDEGRRNHDKRAAGNPGRKRHWRLVRHGDPDAAAFPDDGELREHALDLSQARQQHAQSEKDGRDQRPGHQGDLVASHFHRGAPRARGNEERRSGNGRGGRSPAFVIARPYLHRGREERLPRSPCDRGRHQKAPQEQRLRQQKLMLRRNRRVEFRESPTEKEECQKAEDEERGHLQVHPNHERLLLFSMA